MNRKINYTTSNNTTETDFIIVEPPYEFMDWLNDNGVQAEQDGNTYYTLDIDGETRTGETYTVISEEDTDEDLIG